MPSSLGPPHLPSLDPTATVEEAEASRLRFREFSYQQVAGPREALTQLRELCRQWLRPEVHSKEQMLELLVLEQFLGALPPEIQAWVQGRRPGSPEEAAALVEGLQRDPGQLLGWITAHVLKQVVLPAAQEIESLGSPHFSRIVEPLGEASGEGPHDARVEGSAQLSCSVKEEPDADVHDTEEGQGCRTSSTSSPALAQVTDSHLPHLAPSSPRNPAQPHEGHLGHGKVDSKPCHPPRIQEEWGLLDPSQKELHWAAMLEKYGAGVSLGLPRPPSDPHGVLELRAPNEGTKSQGNLHPGGESKSHRKGPPGCPDGPPSWASPSGATASVASTPPGAAQSKPYTCEQCGRGFDWKSVFVIHHRTHTGGQGARAPVLAVGGTKKPPQGPREPGALRHPRRVPPGPRGYACEECGRSFSWKSQLVIHRKSHAGQRRHFCGNCGRGFDWKSQLVIHRKSHGPEAS